MPFQPVAIDWSATKSVLLDAQKVTNQLCDTFTAKGGPTPSIAVIENAAQGASYVNGNIWASGAPFGCLYGDLAKGAAILSAEGASQLRDAANALRGYQGDGVVDQPGLERAATTAKAVLDAAVAKFDVLEHAGFPVA
jgi:hypothetical protein